MTFILYAIVIIFGLFFVIGPILSDILKVAEWGLNKSIEKIEKEANINKTTNTSTSYNEIRFGNWDSEIHWTIAQRERILRAKNSNMTPGLVDHTTKTAKFQGSKGTYQTTLNSCTCPDFKSRQLPCKHIYKLAMQLGEMDIDVSHNISHNDNKPNYVNEDNTEAHTVNINIDVDDIINRAKNSTTEEKRVSSLILDFEDDNKKELNRWEKN